MKLLKKALPLCILALALAICIATLTPKVQAASSGSCGENLTWNLTDAGKLTISGTGDMETFDWAGAPWYEVRDSVKTVVIEDGVTSVAPYAFYRCYKLETAKLPEGIVSIGKSAFEGCTAMKSVNFGSSLTTIGVFAFKDCSKLTKLTFPLSVTRIEGGAFYNCTAMQDVYIADPLAWCKIDFEDRNSNPMQYAYSMYLHGGQEIYSIRLDETVTEIPAFAFKGCSFLSSVSMPETVTSIGEGAFYACSNLGRFTMPKAVTFIGTDAFALCDSLSTLNVSDIGAWCQIEFENPGANPLLKAKRMTVDGETLTSAEIPEGVTAISDYAFYWCDYLKDLVIPESLTAIGTDAFASCTALENIYYAGTESQWSSIAIGDGNRFLENATIHFEQTTPTEPTVPEETEPAPTEPEPTNPDDNWNFVISDGGATINSYKGISGDLVVPAKLGGCPVVAIGYAAFYDDWSLTSIVLPKSVTTIDQYAFNGCQYLTAITLGEKVTTIGKNALNGCNALKHIYYSGTAEQFRAISVGSNNKPLNKVTFHYEFAYGETAGDFTDDSSVSNEDVVYLLWYTLFPESFPLPADGDLNHDGQVTNEDVVVLLWHTLFPEENPL